MNCGELFHLFEKLGGKLTCNMQEEKCLLEPKIKDSILQTYNHEEMVFEPDIFSCTGTSNYKNEHHDMFCNLISYKTSISNSQRESLKYITVPLFFFPLKHCPTEIYFDRLFIRNIPRP